MSTRTLRYEHCAQPRLRRDRPLRGDENLAWASRYFSHDSTDAPLVRPPYFTVVPRRAADAMSSSLAF
ncbi:hypothetical protein ACKZDW_25125 [Ralstonia syzygii subsp. celebesensis]